MNRFWLFLFIFLLIYNPGNAKEINLLSVASDWAVPIPAISLQNSFSLITIEATKGAPAFCNLQPLGINTPELGLLFISLKTTTNKVAELYWTNRQHQFSPLNRFPFFLKRDGRYHRYYLNLAAYNRQKIVIDHLLLIGGQDPGKIEINELKILSPRWPELALAGWQEFWGPCGREADGFRFLVSRSPRLFGQTFLFYVNWLLALALAITLIFRSRSKVKLIFWGLIIIAWVGLDLSSWYTFGLSFVQDQNFLGLKLEEKRALANPGDLYPFIKFVDQKLPAGSSFEVIASGMNNPARFPYYLYPKRRDPRAAFLLVYDHSVPKAIENRFEKWQIFRPGAYIMKAKEKT